ncbi:MAG TPA: type II toxin-antitoxin system ParD family antitoxin [Devosiaceae bacterium]|jgi:antitoxin ParD1/3/4|nr:type II toxin-antitoxin system ParD family antitoxin [Devosiaceae bacterium]
MPSSYTLGEHFEAFVKQLVESGRYASASEVMRDALRLLEEQEQLYQIRLEALREEIRKGLESGDAGPWDVEDVLREAHRRYDEEHKSDAA